MEKKSLLESQFDAIFSENLVDTYKFNVKTMGPKDRKIIQCLTKYSVKGKDCLDIGPGTGRWLHFLKENYAKSLNAVDISYESLSRCAEFCDKTQKADIEHECFNFEDDSFDVIISFEVLEHLREPGNYLAEIYRVSRNGALVLMSIPNIASLISRIRLLLGLLPVAIAADDTHVGFYRQKDIMRLFDRYKMQPIFIPTSISLNPVQPKSKLRLPSNKLLSPFDDSLLFMIQIDK